MQPTQRPPTFLTAIAIFKLAKALACVVLALSAFRLLAPGVVEQFDHWLESLVWLRKQGPRARVIGWLLGLGPHEFRVFGIAATVYAGLYAVQGIGLWFGRRWAEYLVVLETGLLLPFEVWELIQHFTPFKVLVLLANAMIVAYLVRVLRGRNAMESRA